VRSQPTHHSTSHLSYPRLQPLSIRPSVDCGVSNVKWSGLALSVKWAARLLSATDIAASHCVVGSSTSDHPSTDRQTVRVTRFSTAHCSLIASKGRDGLNVFSRILLSTSALYEKIVVKPLEGFFALFVPFLPSVAFSLSLRLILYSPLSPSALFLSSIQFFHSLPSLLFTSLLSLSLHLKPSGMVIIWQSLTQTEATYRHFAKRFWRLVGSILWGHSGPLCHALSLLLSSLSWTSMRRQRATVAACDSSDTWWMAM